MYFSFVFEIVVIVIEWKLYRLEFHKLMRENPINFIPTLVCVS